MVAAMSSRWRHARAGSGRLEESGRGEEEDAATRRWRCCRVVGGRQMIRREGSEGAARGVLEADGLARGGGRTTRVNTEASWWQTTGRHNKMVGAHDVVSGGDDGGDSGDGGCSSEIGGAPPSMPGTAAPATAPVPRGVDDADDAATAKRPPIGRGGGRRWGDRCRGNDRRQDNDDDYANHSRKGRRTTGRW